MRGRQFVGYTCSYSVLCKCVVHVKLFRYVRDIVEAAPFLSLTQLKELCKAILTCGFA